MANTDAGRLRAFELRNHRLVRVLQVDPFTNRSRMVEAPVLGRSGEFYGLDAQALESVMRLPLAKHAYGKDVSLRASCTMANPGSDYRIVTWRFDHDLRLPGFLYAMDFADEHNMAVAGMAVLFKFKVWKAELCWGVDKLATTSVDKLATTNMLSVQDGSAVDLDKVPRIAWLDRKETDRQKTMDFQAIRLWAEECGIPHGPNSNIPSRVRCTQCHKVPDGPARKCSRCLLTEYCSKECQQRSCKLASQ